MPQYLSKFELNWHPIGTLPTAYCEGSLQVGSEEYQTAHSTALGIESVMRRFRCLTAHIHDALKKAKPQLTNPTVHTFCIDISREARLKFYKPKTWVVFVEIEYDPLDLLQLPLDRAVLGELAIKWIETALEKLRSYPEFPSDIIRNACEKFRKEDYSYVFKAGEKTIEQTSVKGRIDVIANPVSTTRTFTASYRNKKLFSRVISIDDGCDLYFSKIYSGATVWGNFLVINGTNLGLDPQILPNEKRQTTAETPTAIDLREYPEVYELIMNTK